jgi:hypothetical protein
MQKSKHDRTFFFLPKNECDFFNSAKKKKKKKKKKKNQQKAAISF